MLALAFLFLGSILSGILKKAWPYSMPPNQVEAQFRKHYFFLLN